MNLLLVVPRFTLNIKRSYSFPIGLAYISAALKNAKFNVKILNLNQVDGDIDKLIKKSIISNNIDVVLSGGLSQHINLLKDIFTITKNINNNIITIGGGGAYTSEPLLFSKLTNVDYAVLGEGEITTVELIKALKNNENIDKVVILNLKQTNQ